MRTIDYTLKVDIRNISLKGGAVLLMALMLFINIAKLVHTHSDPKQEVISGSLKMQHPANENFSHDNRCSICGFEFFKNADLREQVVVTCPLQKTAIPSANQLPSLFSLVCLSSSGLAPPAVA